MHINAPQDYSATNATATIEDCIRVVSVNVYGDFHIPYYDNFCATTPGGGSFRSGFWVYNIIFDLDGVVADQQNRRKVSAYSIFAPQKKPNSTTGGFG